MKTMTETASEAIARHAAIVAAREPGNGLARGKANNFTQGHIVTRIGHLADGRWYGVAAWAVPDSYGADYESITCEIQQFHCRPHKAVRKVVDHLDELMA